VGWRQRQLSIPWLEATIQATPEAIQSRERGLRLAHALEVVARSLRLLGSLHPDARAIGVRAAAAMGQAPFEPPSVKGWPVESAMAQPALAADAAAGAAAAAHRRGGVGQCCASGRAQRRPHADSAVGLAAAGGCHPRQPGGAVG
jgi:uncharacterized protein (DUF1800 family)